jgi:hypothetical protein
MASLSAKSWRNPSTVHCCSDCCEWNQAEGSGHGLQRFGIIYDDNGKSGGHPRGMPLVTRMLASSEHGWDPMASSSAKSCSKTRTVLCCLLRSTASKSEINHCRCLQHCDRVHGNSCQRKDTWFIESGTIRSI